MTGSQLCRDLLPMMSTMIERECYHRYGLALRHASLDAAYALSCTKSLRSPPSRHKPTAKLPSIQRHNKDGRYGEDNLSPAHPTRSDPSSRR